MKRYGHYLVKDGADVYALSLHFTETALRLARFDIISTEWKAKRHENRDKLEGLTKLAFEIRQLPNGIKEETEFYCKPEDCIYDPPWRRPRQLEVTK